MRWSARSRSPRIPGSGCDIPGLGERGGERPESTGGTANAGHTGCGEVGDLDVFSDPLFERVFYNLIDNALRYGGRKMTMIRITSRESETGLVISVEDNGVGISADDKKRLFERGFGHHTGLGLFLSREILAITGITITETGNPARVQGSRSMSRRGITVRCVTNNR